MSEPTDWTSIAKRLDRAPRGARSRLAATLKMDRSQLAKTLRRKDYPKVDQLELINRFFDSAGSVPPEEMAANDAGDAPMRVPLYGFAAGSLGDRIAFNDGEIIDYVDLPRGMTLNGEFFVVQTIGSSMEPRIWAGERKLVQRRVPPARDQDAVIEFRDGTAVMKTYRGERDGQVFAQQYNPLQEVRYDASLVKAIHAVFPL